MGLQLYMVGVIVEDMARSLEFYRRLGMEFPEGSDEKPHVEVKMNDFSFFLSTKALTAKWDPARTEAHEGGYRIILEFYLKSEAEVRAKHAKMLSYGYKNHRSPYPLSNGMCFALVDDPDGNTILLSGDLEVKE
jgi:catechol 2,3-dioxygenase-like lactoylglutathione lyase family enzyme